MKRWKGRKWSSIILTMSSILSNTPILFPSTHFIQRQGWFDTSLTMDYLCHNQKQYKITWHLFHLSDISFDYIVAVDQTVEIMSTQRKNSKQLRYRIIWWYIFGIKASSHCNHTCQHINIVNWNMMMLICWNYTSKCWWLQTKPNIPPRFPSLSIAYDECEKLWVFSHLK